MKSLQKAQLPATNDGNMFPTRNNKETLSKTKVFSPCLPEKAIWLTCFQKFQNLEQLETDSFLGTAGFLLFAYAMPVLLDLSHFRWSEALQRETFSQLLKPTPEYPSEYFLSRDHIKPSYFTKLDQTCSLCDNCETTPGLSPRPIFIEEKILQILSKKFSSIK